MTTTIDQIVDVEVDRLPLTQYLLLELLAARHRNGEQLWTLPTSAIKTLRVLERLGLAEWRPSPAYGWCQGWLTEAGQRAMLSETHPAPWETERTRQIDQIRTLHEITEMFLANPAGNGHRLLGHIAQTLHQLLLESLLAPAEAQTAAVPVDLAPYKSRLDGIDLGDGAAGGALAEELLTLCGQLAGLLSAACRERDLAITHRQEYPTADAYQRTCNALHKHRGRADALAEHMTRIRDMVDNLGRGTDLARLNRLLFDVHRTACRAVNEDNTSRSTVPAGSDDRQETH